jgi:nicotinamidase-related amidase
VKRHERVLDRERSALLVIDLQDAYRGKLHQEERTLAAAGKLVEAAATLGLPVIATEQYPKGLGATRQEIASRLPPGTLRFEKTAFSVLGAPGLEERLRGLGRDQIVVVGIETHVCVSQSVHDLLARGYQAHVVRDAVTARSAQVDEIGFEKMKGSGAVPASLESVLFEWLIDSRSPEFKALQRLVV